MPDVDFKWFKPSNEETEQEPDVVEDDSVEDEAPVVGEGFERGSDGAQTFNIKVGDVAYIDGLTPGEDKLYFDHATEMLFALGAFEAFGPGEGLRLDYADGILSHVPNGDPAAGMMIAYFWDAPQIRAADILVL